MLNKWHRRQLTILSVLAAALGITMLLAGGANAQTLGLWGGWNEYGQGWQGDRPNPSTQTPNYFSDQSDQAAFPPLMDGGPRPIIEPSEPPRVDFANTETPGTILIDTDGRKLYFTLSPKEAYEYPISVGREGFTWTGTESISRIAEWPDWYPPEEMRQRDPRLPMKMLGGLRNPLGATALFLGNSLYRIHGTNDAKTIGFAASSGCFRMLNEHIVHLAALASVGTTVKVLPHLAMPDTAAEELPWLRQSVGVSPQNKSGS